VTIFNTYAQSVAGVPVPLHGCWANQTHLDAIWNTIGTTFEYVFNIFRFSDLHIYSHTKKNYQGDNNRNRSPLDIYLVYHEMKNTKGCQ